MSNTDARNFIERIDQLRRQVRVLATALVIMGMGLFALAAAPLCERSNLTLKGPDGSTITLDAGKGTPGIWISRGKKQFPMVALYNDKFQGPVVGVFKDEKSPKTMTAALCVSNRGGGQLFFIDDKGHTITLD